MDFAANKVSLTFQANHNLIHNAHHSRFLTNTFFVLFVYTNNCYLSKHNPKNFYFLIRFHQNVAVSRDSSCPCIDTTHPYVTPYYFSIPFTILWLWN